MGNENLIKDRIVAAYQAAKVAARTARIFAWLRVGAFLGLAGAIIASINTAGALPYLIAIPILLAAFLWLISKYNQADHKYRVLIQLGQLNEDEISRLQLDLAKLDDGAEFEDDLHPYSQDLDVFGTHSLFQLLSRSPIYGSRSLLARWLKSKSDPDTILQRQGAAKELAAKLDWTQHFVATARVIRKKQKRPEQKELEALFQWAKEPETFRRLTVLRIFGFFMAIVSLSLLVTAILELVPYQYFLLSYVVNAMLLGVTFKKCKELGDQLNQSQMIVSTYWKLIKEVESESFESPLLKEAQARLGAGQASVEIKRLDDIATWFNSRASFFYVLLSPVLLIDYHILARAISWKNKQAGHIRQWFEVVDEFGVIAGIAGHTWLHAEHTFPVFTEEPFTLSGKKIGHLLIDGSKRIYNDFSFREKGEVSIVTGSNMSGKSTFERTLGVNIVLAQLGAPVCADNFTLHPMEIFTSMRTKDNLEESTSSFYAELKRLRQLLDHVEVHPVTFYVIDEVLKGTNSEDRYKGAVSLAKQLAGKNCFGLISTHDLSLSKLAEGHPLMTNYSFNSTIEGDQIIFDYKLTPGPCRSFNASKLMENMGIIKEVD